MGATASAVRIRHDLHTRLINARKRTDELFRIVREDALYDRPIAERHRIIFYVGHLEAFDWNLLAERAFGLRPFQRTVRCEMFSLRARRATAAASALDSLRRP